MFEELGAFDQPFTKTPDGGGKSLHVRPLRRRKTLKQKFVFWSTNVVFMPFVALIYLSIGAEGLRQLMGIFSMRLYKLPVPGAGLLRQYDGWDRLDLSMLMALILFGTVTFIWIRVFTELLGFGYLAEQRSQNPILFFLLAGMAAILVLGDCGIFYLGLASQASSSWSDTPEYVPAVATVAYMCGLSLLGFFHADHHCSGTV